MSELDEQKRALRTRMAGVLRGVTEGEAGRAGEALLGHLGCDARFGAAARVGLFAATHGEPDTRAIFEHAREAGRTVLLPRCIAGPTLAFCETRAWDELEAGRYGLAEPTAAASRTPWQSGDIVLVPGLAFDECGGRLGRGRGYYDHAFGDAPAGAPFLIGTAFDLQIVEQVPMGSLDRRLDGIVTPSGIRWRAEKRTSEEKERR